MPQIPLKNGPQAVPEPGAPGPTNQDLGRGGQERPPSTGVALGTAYSDVVTVVLHCLYNFDLILRLTKSYKNG